MSDTAEKMHSEALFEQFLNENSISFSRIREATSPRPDYKVSIGTQDVYVEIKELTGEPWVPGQVYTSRPGQRLRNFIKGSRRQIQYGANLGFPSICLVYHAIQPIYRIGTEPLDFRVAMYGHLTVSINPKTMSSSDIYHGGKRSFTEDNNTSFAAIGIIDQNAGKLSVELHENIFGSPALHYEGLPKCFNVTRYSVEL